MSNIFIIGDMHLKCSSPVSRKDDYPIAILNKIEFLADIAKSYRCKTFLLLGDVFDSPVTSLPYLATVINTFKKVNEHGIKVYTIVGNHDIKNNRMDSLQSTALGILISTGYVNLAPRELVIDNTLFRCYHYPEQLDVKQTDSYEMCVAHRYYEFGFAEDSLSEQDVKDLNYDAMALGHYHVPCDTINIGQTILYRPGSLSRSTSEPYNKLRTPRVLVFNCKNHKATYVEVSCGTAEEVFVEQQEDSSMPTLSMSDLVKFISSSYSSSDMNIREYFGNLDIPYECRAIIAKYLDNVGA